MATSRRAARAAATLCCRPVRAPHPPARAPARSTPHLRRTPASRTRRAAPADRPATGHTVCAAHGLLLPALRVRAGGAHAAASQHPRDLQHQHGAPPRLRGAQGQHARALAASRVLPPVGGPPWGPPVQPTPHSHRRLRSSCCAQTCWTRPRCGCARLRAAPAACATRSGAAALRPCARGMHVPGREGPHAARLSPARRPSSATSRSASPAVRWTPPPRSSGTHRCALSPPRVATGARAHGDPPTLTPPPRLNRGSDAARWPQARHAHRVRAQDARRRRRCRLVGRWGRLAGGGWRDMSASLSIMCVSGLYKAWVTRLCDLQTHWVRLDKLPDGLGNLGTNETKRNAIQNGAAPLHRDAEHELVGTVDHFTLAAPGRGCAT